MADMVYQNTGSFIPTSFVWDIARLHEIKDLNSDEGRELFVRLYQNIGAIALSLNTRDAGYYNTSEFINGQLFFPNPANNSSTAAAPDFRQVYRTVIDFGALPNATIKSVPHNLTITPVTTFTRIYGATSNPTQKLYLGLPYAAQPPSENIDLYVDATNVNIVTGADETLFTATYIVLEYLQS